jgi:nitrogen fixation/metabolism regulation signal transduction histidine kinase
VLAGVPSLLLSWFATDRITDALDRLRIPGLEQSMSTSAVIGGELVDRLNREADILVTELGDAKRLADDELVRREILESRGFDFLAWRHAGGVTVFERTAQSDGPARSGMPTEDDWAAIDRAESPPLLRDDALRFFRTLPSGGGDVALGLRVSGDVARALSSGDESLGRYLQLAVFVEIQKRLVWISWGAIFLVTAAGAFFVARANARRIGRPIAELARSADRLAAGDLAHRAGVQADGEIGELVASFNRMAGEIERSRADLMRAERIAAWRDVARRIAHEIRNPLTPVKLAVHRLRGRFPQDAAAQESLRAIGEEVENLARIAETFSEFARLPEPKFERVDLVRVAKSVAELFQETAPGVTLEVQGDAEVAVRADVDQMRRAMTNLVKNAIDATAPSGGRVVLRVARAGEASGERAAPGAGAPAGRARIEVIDDGPGVPEEMRDLLFRPGFTTKSGGTGLGLALVHRIARDHEGELRLGSESDSTPTAPRGGHFVIEIPIRI